MIVVTGGAGFIGSHLVRELNRAGLEEIVVVDDLRVASKFENLVGARIADYVDKEDFLAQVRQRAAWLGDIDRIFHQGACTSTTEPDGRYMMRNNYDYSRALLELCLDREIPLIYASSAAVYGDSDQFVERPECEAPLNVYGYSKLLFDEHVRRQLGAVRSQVVGLRYFNVYGPHEAHKGAMASLVLQLDDQLQTTGKARLFGSTEGYEPGEQRRDFIYVRDVVAINVWFMEHPDRSGIFNCGTGTSRTFNDLAGAVMDFHDGGEIEYIPFPPALTGRYQSYTEADLTALRAAGFDGRFTPLEDGVAEYLGWRRGETTG